MNNAQSGRGAAAQQREQAIGDYLTACDAGDAEAVAATAVPRHDVRPGRRRLCRQTAHRPRPAEV